MITKEVSAQWAKMPVFIMVTLPTSNRVYGVLSRNVRTTLRVRQISRTTCVFGCTGHIMLWLVSSRRRDLQFLFGTDHEVIFLQRVEELNNKAWAWDLLRPNSYGVHEFMVSYRLAFLYLPPFGPTRAWWVDSVRLQSSGRYLSTRSLNRG